MFERIVPSSNHGTVSPPLPTQGEQWISFAGGIALLNGTSEAVFFEKHSKGDDARTSVPVPEDQLQAFGVSAERLISFHHSEHGEVLVDLKTSRVFSLTKENVLRCRFDPEVHLPFALTEIKNLTVTAVDVPASIPFPQSGVTKKIALSAAAIAVAGGAVWSLSQMFGRNGEIKVSPPPGVSSGTTAADAKSEQPEPVAAPEIRPSPSEPSRVSPSQVASVPAEGSESRPSPADENKPSVPSVEQITPAPAPPVVVEGTPLPEVLKPVPSVDGSESAPRVAGMNERETASPSVPVAPTAPAWTEGAALPKVERSTLGVSLPDNLQEIFASEIPRDGGVVHGPPAPVSLAVTLPDWAEGLISPASEGTEVQALAARLDEKRPLGVELPAWVNPEWISGEVRPVKTLSSAASPREEGGNVLFQSWQMDDFPVFGFSLPEDSSPIPGRSTQSQRPVASSPRRRRSPFRQAV